MWDLAQPVQTPPGGPPRLVTVDDAVVTAYDRGGLRNDLRGPAGWIRGAVHDRDGLLVPASQRRWTGGRLSRVAADPDRVDVPRRARRLEGTWLYAGHWAVHFGHLLVEHLTTYWPEPTAGPLAGPLAGIVVHRPPHAPLRHPRRGLEVPRLAAWQRDLIELAGHDPDGLRIVHGRPLRVDRLVVPERPVLLTRWARPEAVALWQRVAEAVGFRGGDRRVYLSRTRFHTDARPDRARVDQDRDRHLDDVFASAGFAVVHPETMSIAEQVAVVRGADVLAGLSGSAMHLSVFARPGSHVLTLGDARDPARPTRTQQVIDAACGHRVEFVAHGDRVGVERVLDELGG